MITLENEQLSLAFRPDLGGKMISLVHRASGHDFLQKPPEPERGYRSAGYGARFDQFDTSGFDECLPTVAPCRLAGAELPDHGEVWSVPWTCERDGDALLMQVRGTALPYALTRRVHLRRSTVVLDYELASTGASPFPWLWSAHPLLAVEPDARILLPEDVGSVYVNASVDEDLGRHGDIVSWPIARRRDGTNRDLSWLAPRSVALADKLFTPRLTRGWCAVYLPRPDLHLAFRFDPEVVPYVGLWICQGGWPEDRPPKHYTVALEPCTGRPDSLAEAAARGEAQLLEPGATRRWTLELVAGAGRPEVVP